ncbi:MAG: hypothetical protein ISR90_00195 [Candidatus Marinimicrobia bacterium]|nr:hypothetical protein [Candidatus Neomarinimicrobiota bacterium]MBL7022461.1 hypothetical protein [Candidatus Neomarinimicrobiota bacterium]MBL7108684.1 hypothetical protein [Candidatus Neomarinimicrobiota bacterium]
MEKQEFTPEDKLHNYLGIELNIQTWNLLGQKKRTNDDNIRMIQFAKGSLFHWERSPVWEPINTQRGEWMLSHVYAVLEKGELALTHAEKCLELTRKHGFDGFDLAYAYECMARALACLGKTKEYTKFYDLAESFGNKIEGEEDKKIFLSDLKSQPWFGAKK